MQDMCCAGSSPGREVFLYMSEGRDLTTMKWDTFASHVRLLATRNRQLGSNRATESRR